MKRLTLTQYTVRCPLENGTASLTVRSDLDGYPSRRHLDVAACSLVPSVPFAPRPWRGYFSDIAPPASYLCEADPTPRHALKLSCARLCLRVLNAPESGAAEPVRCTSGFSDGFELARQTLSPSMMRLLWFYSS
jgi:hypothetical protein